MDALNIFNHPYAANPTLDINGDLPFGDIATKTGTASSWRWCASSSKPKPRVALRRGIHLEKFLVVAGVCYV